MGLLKKTEIGGSITELFPMAGCLFVSSIGLNILYIALLLC